MEKRTIINQAKRKMPVISNPRPNIQSKINEEKEGKIMNHQEHKRRLDTRNMLVISIPLRNPIKTPNMHHQSPSRQYMLHNRKMVHCTIAMPNQYDQ